MKPRHRQERDGQRWTWPAIVSVAGILLLIAAAVAISVVAVNNGYEPPDVRGTYPSSRGAP